MPCSHIVLPHCESEFELALPKVTNLVLDGVKLAHSLTLMANFEHPLLELSIEDQSCGVVLCKELRDLPVLFNEHKRLTCQFEPTQESVFRKFAVSVQDQVAKTVDGAELVHIASSHPQHLLYTTLLGAIESLLEGLFKLSGGEELHVHAMQSANPVPGALIQVHSVGVFGLQLPILIC